MHVTFEIVNAVQSDQIFKENKGFDLVSKAMLGR